MEGEWVVAHSPQRVRSTLINYKTKSLFKEVKTKYRPAPKHPRQRRGDACSQERWANLTGLTGLANQQRVSLSGQTSSRRTTSHLPGASTGVTREGSRQSP